MIWTILSLAAAFTMPRAYQKIRRWRVERASNRYLDKRIREYRAQKEG